MYEEPNVTSVAFNMEHDDVVVYTTQDTLSVRFGTQNPTRQRLSTLVIAFQDTTIHCLAKQQLHQTEVSLVGAVEQLLAARDLVDAVHVDERLIAYVVDVVGATRDPGSIGLAELKPMILYGGSPRASIALTRAARARAFLDRQAFVGPEHIKRVALGVLQHRVITTYEAEAEGLRSVDVIERILDAVPIP